MPPAFGALQEALDSWRHSFAILTVLPGLATAAFLCAKLTGRRCRDYREEAQHLAGPAGQGGGQAPDGGGQAQQETQQE